MRKISIPLKLSITYIIIMFAAIVSGVFCLTSLYKYHSLDEEITLKNTPCINLLKDGIYLSNKVENLSNKFFYTKNKNSKDELLKTLNNEFKPMNNALLASKQYCTTLKEIQFIEKATSNNFAIIKNIKTLINKPIIETTINKNITEKIVKNTTLLNQFLNKKNIRQNEIIALKEKLIHKLIIIVFCAVFIILLLSILSVYYTKRHISQPLKNLKHIIHELSTGKIRDITPSKTYDEISEIQNSLQHLIIGIKAKMKFAEEIGHNNLNHKLELLSNEDSFGISLNKMSQNLTIFRSTSESLALSLEEAQSISKTGNWSMEVKSGDFKWSKQLFQIFEIDMELSFDKVIEEYKRKIPKEDRIRIKETFNDTIKSGEKYEYEHRILLDDGRVKYIKGIGQAVLNDQNKTIGIKGIVQDITAFKQIEHELRNSKEKAENLSKTKDEFMSSMSHEIRTPLNGIIGFTDILIKDKSLNETQLKQLEAIKTSGDILLVIINDILDIAKIEAGKMTLEKIPVNLNELLPLIIDTFAVKINNKQLNVSIEIDQNLTYSILSDSVRLSQIFFNFISNAIKFTPDNGNIKISITVIKETDLDSTLAIKVSDSGIGIPHDKLDFIFEPFTQTSDDTSRVYGGTGLGLTIVKKIVDLIGGKISVESNVGAGTTFKIKATFLKEQTNLQNSFENIESNTNLPASNLTISKILLVEDNAINQLLAQTVLSSLGYDVKTVENGSEALDELKHNQYDLILMDLMMPIMDGYDASIAIRANKNNIPIIALTADVTSSVKKRCKEIGINDYISKPFDSKDLNEKINGLINAKMN